MLLSPQKAAIKAGVSRKTIMNHIKSSSLKATRNNENNWAIHPTDLANWMKKTGFSPNTSPTTEPSQPSINQQWEAEAAVLEAQIDGVMAQLAVVTNQMERLTSENAELRTEAREARKDSREAWAAYRELAQRLLTNNSVPPTPEAPLVLEQSQRVQEDDKPDIPVPLQQRTEQVLTADEPEDVLDGQPTLLASLKKMLVGKPTEAS